ncbi:MAG: hypothetical protein M3P24_07155 [Gemmatimonadota bacterium]|nr:hypothetical protein [Gemmatimonadota bacterium]
MRTIFWLVAFAALALFVVSFAFPAPSVGDASGREIGDWFGTQLVFSGAAGILGGVLGAVAARSRLRHLPRETAVSYLDRAGARGVWTVLGSGALAVLVFCYFASGNVSVRLAPLARVAALAASMKFVGIAALSCLLAAISYAVLTRMMTWSGQYALLGPSFTPRLSSND